MNSCFGCLLKVNLENWNKKICGQIVHYLLQRRVVSLKKKEVWFIIDGKPILFGMKEFAMITGLNCGKIPTGKALYDEGKAKDFLDLVLNKKSSLTGNDLKEILKSDRFDAQTKLKIAMVWFVESFLWAGDQKRTVDIKNMKMVTNLDYFNAYPWGRRSFEMTVEFLLNVNLKKKSVEWKENNSTSKGYSLQGFPWAFMVWAFEAIPILGEAFGQPLIESPLPLPRLLRWYDKKKTPPDYKTVLLTMQNKEVVVHPTLVPTNVESKKSYLINWEDLKDEVDENIDRLTKVVSGVTRLVNSSLERHEIPVAMDHDGRETDIRRQPSKGVTENINLSDSPGKLSQLIELCANMFNEMKDMNKKLNERMDGLDAKIDHFSGMVGGLHVQVEKLSKKKV
ncbi:uncharacterized protein LOC132642704 [Lycium barbarum]|uniref:uncharacterized protein LOC132642704 n=1 Tax=Lycium barbarum TaxID=112863 RepID=UPI00293E2B3E|nr:uncharacterized protein LOC132642704 [Lycium barbarum]